MNNHDERFVTLSGSLGMDERGDSFAQPVGPSSVVEGLICLSIALLLAAMFFPALATCQQQGYFSNPTPDVALWRPSSLDILFGGWFAVFTGQIAWFANVFFVLIGSRYCFKRAVPTWMPILQLILAFWMFLPVKIPRGEAWDEYFCLKGVGLGAILWLLAQVTLASSALWNVRTRNIKNSPKLG